MKKSSGYIEITQVPDGEAPIDVRMAWVGLVLPCDPYLGYPDNGLEQGVLTGKPSGCQTCGRNGFSVPQEKAIAILERANTSAASWWKSHGFPQPGKYFGFAEGEAKIIRGVTRQTIIHVTEEMMGNPER